MDVFTPFGTNATFTCEIDEDPDDIDSLAWILNFEDAIDTNVVVDIDSTDEEFANLGKRGIYMSSSGMLISLTVLATIENNGTRIKCKEMIFPFSDFSDQATLTVTGKIMLKLLFLNLISINRMIVL